MKTQYTIEDLTYFFETQKQMSHWYKIDKVHQLINNPHAKATHTVSIHHNPLKFIIMTSTIIISLIGLGFWLFPETSQENQILETSNPIITTNEMAVDSYGESREDGHQPMENAGLSEAQNETNLVIREIDLLDPVPESNGNEMPHSSAGRHIAMACNWPEDTVLDKHDLFVYLTNTELKKLGVIIKGNTMYYKNSPDGKSTYTI